MLLAVLGASLILAALRYRPAIGLVAAWLAYSGRLVRAMAHFRWSDVAMSGCFLLILLPPMVLLLVFAP